MKPNAIFISSSEGHLRTVYSSDLRERMAEKLNFLPQLTRFDAETLNSRRDELRSVEYFFSTWGMPHFSCETLREYFPNVKGVFYGAGSVQSFAREFLEEERLVVSAWAANAIPVAEFTVSQIILANKGYFQRTQMLSGENWPNRSAGGQFHGNYHTKVGLIGAGMVGRAVISLLKNFVLDVYVCDPFLPDEVAEAMGVTKVSLEWMFRECDVISNHLANNPQTVGMLNYALFSTMKSNACFINTGRGAQVVEADLARAMEEQPDRVALLDVTIVEPPAADSPFYRLPNIFLSPHIAGSLGDEVQRMGEYMFEEYCRLEKGEQLRYSVSLEMLKTMA